MRIISLISFLTIAFASFGQLSKDEAKDKVFNHIYTTQGIPKEAFIVSDYHIGNTTKLSYFYLQQCVDGVPIYNAISTYVVSTSGLVANSAKRYHAKTIKNIQGPSLQEEDVVSKACDELYPGKKITIKLSHQQMLGGQLANVYLSDQTRSEIIVRRMYIVDKEGALTLCYDFDLDMKGAENWWSIRADVSTGKIIDKSDRMLRCGFGHCQGGSQCQHHEQDGNASSPENTHSAPGTYNVFPFPVEAPTFGPRSLLVGPEDALASPFGWHDTNAVTGADYTITRGNNVYVYEDAADQDVPGYSPDGGNSLVFNFPYSGTSQPINNRDAALTNLFYVNNYIHDWGHYYGFNEAAGNFQVTNYSGQGQGFDDVYAEGFDGGGVNNANMATPPDGSSPRMQMYLWGGNVTPQNHLIIHSPAGVAGSYLGLEAAFGPGISTTVTANLVLMTDGTAPANDGCDPLLNSAALAGNIAVVDRGSCNFIIKAQAAEAAGAIGLIVLNNSPTAIFSMGGTGTANIPAIMVSQADGNIIKTALQSGPISASLVPVASQSVDKDGNFDNGIVLHEFTHGISNRLTGGASNTNCLGNAEQMGEGWSDYLAIAHTIRQGDVGTTARGVGTYASSELTTGPGIRNYPYSTNMAVNPQTLGTVNSVTGVHAIGEIWAVMLWDLTWDLIAQYGFDPNTKTGTGGNNIAMRLVMEGMKLQPCSPGFVDGRDAILLADELLYNGQNKCLIWRAFARRGLGYTASQGDSDVSTDQVEAFDLPPLCRVATTPPTADFNFTIGGTCSGVVRFNDLSTGDPNQWIWSFGDGGSSNIQNPLHTYNTSGTYDVKLKVRNALGEDSLEINGQVVISLPSAPVTQDVTVCVGSNALLNATATNASLLWHDNAYNFLFRGNPYQVNNVTASQTYFVRGEASTTLLNVGPANNTFGGGGNHNNASIQYLNFTVSAPLILEDVLVYAATNSTRKFYLWDGNGALLDSAVITTTTNGSQRVNLGFTLQPGDYRLGGSQMNLYRSNSGANYPYQIQGMVSITGSSAGASFYYYAYDWRVKELCLSPYSRVVLNAIPNPTPSFTYSESNGVFSFTNTSTSTLPATSFQWNFGDNTSSSITTPTPHTFASNGQYTITLTADNGSGCIGSFTQTVNVTTDVYSLEQSIGKVVPNPNDGKFMLFWDGNQPPPLSMSIYNNLGQLVARFDSPNLTQPISVDNLSNGMYHIELIETDGGKAHLKFVVER